MHCHGQSAFQTLKIVPFSKHCANQTVFVAYWAIAALIIKFVTKSQVT